MIQDRWKVQESKDWPHINKTYAVYPQGMSILGTLELMLMLRDSYTAALDGSRLWVLCLHTGVDEAYYILENQSKRRVCKHLPRGPAQALCGHSCMALPPGTSHTSHCICNPYLKSRVY